MYLNYYLLERNNFAEGFACTEFCCTYFSMCGLALLLSLIQIPTVPAIGFTIFGVILSICTGFRNNACYDRWWEGRKLWGALIANARHIVRDSHVLTNQQREHLIHQVLIFSNLLRDRLRQQTVEPTKFLEHAYLNNSSLNYLNEHINAPQFVLENIQKI